MIRILYLLILSSTLWSLAIPLFAQSDKAAVRATGAVAVQAEKPIYLYSDEVTIAIKLPYGWSLDSKNKYPFYFWLKGDSYESSHTYMYITVEALEVTFEQSINADVSTYKQYCSELNIENLPTTSLLQQDFENNTQIFTCNKEQEPYVDLITKINFNGSLVHVALSAETSDEIELYRKDYNFLLKHLIMIKSVINPEQIL
ncbi:MAG: hypothetical protein P8Z37_08975 [Acidobacteriota bacterium]|jgi:hypothetical protein